jgi:hypothetical protein
LVDRLIELATDVFTNAFANTSIGIFDLSGALHPSHAEAVTEQRPYIHTATSFTVNGTYFALGGLLSPESEAGVFPYQVGTYRELKATSLVGDGLEVHHVGQAHAFKQLIPGYSPTTAPAIVLPKDEHLDIPRLRGTIELTARQVLARDIWNLRRLTKAPRSALLRLIGLNKSLYPGAFDL